MQLRERISAGGARRLRRLNTLIAGGGISLVGDRTTKRHECGAPACSMARNALQLVRQLHSWLSSVAGRRFGGSSVLLVQAGDEDTLARFMAWKRKVTGSVLAVVGFMLSPLSWWNDLVVNVPLALAFAWLVSLFYKPAFTPSLVIGYWLTNVAGFVLMHKGAQKLLSERERRYSWRNLARDVAISLLYTALIVALVEFGVLKPIQSYFQAP